MASKRIRTILDRLKNLKRRKTFWLSHFQLIGEYVLTRKQNFTERNEPGAFLDRELFDNTASKSNAIMSSAMLGNLWPNGAKTFQIIRPRNIAESAEIKEYFEKVTLEMTSLMDDSRSGLTISLNEYMLDQGAFGTSGIGIFENPKGPLPIRYRAWDVKTMNIDEDNNGFVDTIYNETLKSVRKVVMEYGIDNVSTTVRDLFNAGKEEEIRILHAIEPRLDADPFKFGNKDMPIASIHIEIKSEKILRESGFEEMPVPVSRFSKALGEIYGRSPAMAALSDVIELNVIWEAVTVATEKNLDPPLMVLSDGDLGPAVIDTSAGAINVFNVAGRAGKFKPIEPMFTVGEMQSSIGLIEKLVQSITEHFFIDRLLDLNNDTRMTLGEAQIRNELRAASLGTTFSRQEAELFTPMITRTFNLLLKLGHLGVISGSREDLAIREKGLIPFIIPESIANAMLAGQEVFRIRYISPAKRAMQAEEVQGILATFNFLGTVVPIVPTILDNYKIDDIARKLSELLGMPEELIEDLESMKDLRDARAAAEAQANRLELLKQSSEVLRNVGQAKNTGGSAEDL